MKTALKNVVSIMAACALAACGKAGADSAPAGDSVSAKQAADMLHAVMEADRTAYTRNVVNRLTKTEQVTVIDPVTEQARPLRASENWKSEHGSLPLPAQMFRMGAEQVLESNAGFSYVLLSKWPVNKQNAAKTEMEREGLEHVAANRGAEPFYATETLGGARADFATGDVMGGVVIRIPIGH